MTTVGPMLRLLERLLVIAALATFVLLAAGACHDDDEPSARQRCEDAWDHGLGNASDPGIDRDAWLAECVEELEAEPGQ